MVNVRALFHQTVVVAMAVVWAAVGLSTMSLAQESAPSVRAVREWRQTREPALLTSYLEFLHLPNVSRDLPNIRRNADYLMREMDKRGLHPRLLEVPNAPPAVYGELRSPNATHTYVFYAHYDGQPVDPHEWATAPFEPTLTSGRLDKSAKAVAVPSRG